MFTCNMTALQVKIEDGVAILSFRELLRAANDSVATQVLDLCRGRPIVVVSAQLMEVGGSGTHGLPVISAAGADDVWQYPIAEIALAKLRISAVTGLSSQDVPEKERIRISGFPYYGSTVFRIHPKHPYRAVVAASGLRSDEDVVATKITRAAVKQFFFGTANALAEQYPGVTLRLIA